MNYYNYNHQGGEAGNVCRQAPAVGVKISNATGRFCIFAVVIAAVITFFCFVDISEWKHYTASIGVLIAGTAIFCGLLSVFNAPLRAKVGSASAAVVVSLFFLLNVTFSDGAPYKSYTGHFVEKTYKASRHRHSTSRHYGALYRADNGREKEVDISEEEYYDNNIPQTITMYEHRGLFGIKLYNEPSSPLRNFALLFLALDLYWLAAIYCFSKHNLNFKGWKRWVAMGLVAISMFVFAVSDGGSNAEGVYIATIVVSGLAMILSAVLAFNYWIIEECRMVPGILAHKRVITSSKFGPTYTLYLQLPSGYMLHWDTGKEEYEKAEEGQQMNVNVGRGCFGLGFII